MSPHPPPVPLSKLVAGLAVEPLSPDRDPIVCGLAYDSRRVRAGDLFICLRGRRDDGHRYAREAARRGAVAVLVDGPVHGLDGLPQVTVKDNRRSMGQVAARFYGEPAARLHVTGVTGTEGKTTTTYLFDAILGAAGLRTGMFGTIVNKVAARVEPATLTTPDSPDLQRLLWECVEAGVTHVVMEVTSHGLVQERVTGCEFDRAVFTNLHTDHLDFHGTVETYREAKAELFANLGRGATKAGQGMGVANFDDPSASYMRRACSRPIVGFGMVTRAPVRGELLAADLNRTLLRARTPRGEVVVALPLVGPFNAANALAAITVAHTMGIELETIQQGLQAAPRVPGRFEVVSNAQGRLVVIDFAHTQAAFEAVLPFLRRLARGRLITVFGCAGDRDRSKRPAIGRLVARLSDLAIVTTDNPASEDPAAIAEEVLVGIREVDPRGDRHLVLLARVEAVRRALALARPDDAVLVAGKGHEDYQLVDGRRILYSDRETIEGALRASGRAR